jgi:hypothetical protein
MYLHAPYAKRDEDHGAYDLCVYVDETDALAIRGDAPGEHFCIGDRGDAKASIDALVEALTCLRAQIEATDKIRAGRAAA